MPPTLSWIAPKAGRKKVVASINKKVRERAATQLSGPEFRIVQVDGVLDMADFNRRDPAIGSAVACTFAPEDEDKIQSLLRQPVRVRGLAKIQPHSEKVDYLEIQQIQPLPSLALGEGNFFAATSISQLAATQGIKPLKNAQSLSGLLTDVSWMNLFPPAMRIGNNSGRSSD